MKFDDITRLHPELQEAATELAAWLASYPHAEFTVDDLHRGLGEKLSASEIMKLLLAMAETGRVKIVYSVMDPEGYLTSDRQPSVETLPPKTFDRRSAEFDVDNDSIVPVYEMVGE